MNWTALYAILKKSINTTKEELEQEIEEKIGLTNQFLDELPETGESGVLYFIPKDDADPSAEDQYFMYVWDPDNTEFVLLDPDVDLSPYAKSADLATVATSGLYSDLSGTPDLTPYITEEEADEKYMSYDILEEETVTGNPITFESLDGGYAKSCEVTFSPIQDLHGQSNPYPAGGGKNKLDLANASLSKPSWYGGSWNVATLNSNNGLTIARTYSQGGAGGFTVTNLTPLEQYTISFEVGDKTTRYDLGAYYTTDGTTGTEFIVTSDAMNISGNNRSKTFIVPENAIEVCFRPTLHTGDSPYDINNIQIESGSASTAYAPYSNICPISGRDSLVLTRTGKNVLPNNYTNGYYFGSSGQLVENEFCKVSDYAPVISGQTYIYSATDLHKGSASQDVYVQVCFYDASKTFIERNKNVQSGNVTFTPTVNTKYVRVSAGVLADNLQIELGTTATEYEPYQGTTHTATFSETVYGGSWKATEGKAVITWVKKLIKDLNWTLGDNNTFYAYISDKKPGVYNLITEIYKIYDGSVQTMPDFSYKGHNSQTVIYIRDTNYDTAIDLTTNMGDYAIVYELATPTEITLTAEQIELLKGQNVLWTDGDNITLTAAQLELIKVKANPSGQATDTLSKLQINDDIFGIPAELPVVASTDEGKVLTVNSYGEWEAADIPEQVEANPADTATTDLTKLGVGGTVYGIPAAPTIVANPSGAATDILDKLQVGSTVYATPKQLDYSTAEQKTGVKWIDGRDIYQRTFVKTLASSPDADASSFLIASGLDTIDVLIDISGTVKANGVHAFCGTTGLINGNGWKYSIHLDSDDQLVVWAGSSSDYYNEIAGGKAFITIKYVKNLYPVSDPWPTGTGYGIGNFEWDDQMTSDIATDAHSWDSRYFTSDDPWWIKYISTNLDGSINVKAQHAWMDEEPGSANHFTFNKYYEPFYITTDTSIAYGCYAWASYTVAQDGTITRTGADYERCDVEPKLYIRSTDSYLTQINNEWFFKMHQEIPGYLIYANWSKLSNWLVESGNYQHIKEPLWKVN